MSLSQILFSPLSALTLHRHWEAKKKRAELVKSGQVVEGPAEWVSGKGVLGREVTVSKYIIFDQRTHRLEVIRFDLTSNENAHIKFHTIFFLSLQESNKSTIPNQGFVSKSLAYWSQHLLSM